jgi:predicted NAD/FAD-dependent oxidoreductase
VKVAVIGAGITGCLLADFLDSESIDVSVYEKSRGCGGRASTKQTEFGQCDLGATIVPVKNTEFAGFLSELEFQNLVCNWPENVFVTRQVEGIFQPLEKIVSARNYYVFNEKMNAACHHWVKNSQLFTNSLVKQLRYLDGKGWQLNVNDTWLAERFDKVIVTAPWPQSQALIYQSELSAKLADYSQSWTSCWSIALELNPIVASNVDLIYLKNHAVQTLVRDSNKPKRTGFSNAQGIKLREIWVAQLANELSDEIGKLAKNKAIGIAKKCLCELFDLPDESVSNTYGHFWQYARPSPSQRPLGIMANHEQGVYVGGDWSFGASIESAFDAAVALRKSIKTGL